MSLWGKIIWGDIECKNQVDRSCYSGQDILLSLTKQCIKITDLWLDITSAIHTDKLNKQDIKEDYQISYLKH